jgi:hypothetical protein
MQATCAPFAAWQATRHTFTATGRLSRIELPGCASAPPERTTVPSGQVQSV